MSNWNEKTFNLNETAGHLKNDRERGEHLPTMPDPVHDPQRGQRLPTDPDPAKKPTPIDDPNHRDESDLDASDVVPESAA